MDADKAKVPDNARMIEHIEQEILYAMDEQVIMMSGEILAGNIVKKELHKGVILGLRIVLDILNKKEGEVGQGHPKGTRKDGIEC